MSDIFKKVTSIEPDDGDALRALNITPSEDTPKADAPKRPLVTSIIDDKIDNDPVPEFITRSEETSSDITSEDLTQESPAIDPVLSAGTIGALASNDIAPPSSKWMTWVGIISVILWLGASFSYLYGFFDLGKKWTDMTPMQITGLIMAILLPAILLGLLFYALRQLSKLTHQSHSLARAAFGLTQPDESVIAKTSIMSQAIKTEVDSIDARIDQALARMSSLEGVLKEQTQNMSDATQATSQTTDEIASRLSTQRLALESIAGTFDHRMEALSTNLADHSNKLDASTHLAEQKIQEARISVESAAERINAASEIVRGNTVEATTTLTKSHEEIESLANMIRERSAELDEVYRKHAQDLTGMIAELRDEQQNMSISLEERLTKMRDMALSAKVSAESLTDASEAGRTTVEALAEATRLTDTAVKQRFSDMEDMVRFSGEKADSISDQAARRVQDSLAHTRKEIARIENDMMALQTRLSAPKPAEALPLEEPKQPKPKKQGRIRLKPLEDDFPPIEAPRFEDEPTVLRPTPIEDAEPVVLEDNLIVEEDFSIKHEATDLTQTDPDIEIKEFPTETIQRTVPVSDDIITSSKKKKEKSSWRWRDMLGGLERPDATNAMDALTSRPKQREISDQRMIASLTDLGLSPAAIIDDGCIIEAANTRKIKGSLAMSQAVAKRMGDPVRHLHRAMEENPALKTDARAYVAQFQARMETIENDREAIRTRLESDAGRTYMLCDAALNG